MEKVDIAIIGAGVIGLAASYVLSGGDKEILVIERNDSFGQEISSRNSEVIHGGIYYPKDSFKSRTCIRGRDLLYELCARHNIPHKKLGKLLVACDKVEIEKLEAIYRNATHCGVDNLRFLEKQEIKKMEPDVSAERALFCPDTGIIDSHSLMKFFFNASKEKGVDFAFGVEVIGIEKRASYYQITVKEPQGEHFSFQAKAVINSAGLDSDKIAEMVGIDAENCSYRLHYCKGQYFRIRNPKKFSITHPVYPPPTNIDLGIHVTPDLADGLRLGPDAKYVRQIDYNINDDDKPGFFQSVKRFLNGLELDDLIQDTAGIRPKLQTESEDFRDFVISNEEEKGFPNFINLIGIESPGLTSCLAIAETVKRLL
ncbi:MAG: NAD(P)/FAD-dependent oxidoreductase [Candidatus Omnitrophota bacterium]